MNTKITPMQPSFIPQAVDLDRTWFGDHGISKVELEKIITGTNYTLAIIKEHTLFGFTTYEVLENTLPTDYNGTVIFSGRFLFIQQFTTTTNYQIDDSSRDSELLDAVEHKAIELKCNEVWEALATDHPYKKENNPKHDAFGFYLSHGFIIDNESKLAWKPNTSLSIPCFLFRLKTKLD